MRWSNADQQFEGTLSEYGLTSLFVIEFLAVLNAGDVRQTLKEIVIIVVMNNLSDPRHIVYTLV